MNRAIYDEMRGLDGNGEAVLPHYQRYCQWLDAMPPDRLAQKRTEAEVMFHRLGITFAVYGEQAGGERLIPFDIIPRIIPAADWHVLERGLAQRVKALNHFLHDIYNGQTILEEGLIPAEKVLKNAQYRPLMEGVSVPGSTYAHVTGVDIVFTGPGEFHVLEDNLRVPSGVSYMLENRKMMMRLFPELFARQQIQPVEHYPDILLETLRGGALTWSCVGTPSKYMPRDLPLIPALARHEPLFAGAFLSPVMRRGGHGPPRAPEYLLGKASPSIVRVPAAKPLAASLARQR